MALLSPFRSRFGLPLSSLAALLLTLSIVAPPRSQGQEIGRLYATRPPPGYAFIRIATLSDGNPPQVQVNSADLRISTASGASSYRAVPGNQPLNLAIDGSTISKDIAPGPEAYLTLVISKTNSSWAVQSIDEGQSSSDGLKARLRFFNLVPGCTAALKIADGPTIFQQTPFPDDPETLKAMLLAERHESERLRQIIKELQRHRFGRKAESLPEEQMLLGLEDVQQVAACTEASQDETAPEGRAERARKRRKNRGALPTHLPRIEALTGCLRIARVECLLVEAGAASGR